MQLSWEGVNPRTEDKSGQQKTGHEATAGLGVQRPRPVVAPEKDGGSWDPFSYCAPKFRVKFTTVLSAGLCYTVTPAGFQVLPALLYSASFISKPTSKDTDSGGNPAAIITAPGHALPG